ncbi:hypothetical protein ACQPYK_43305 [Streptosporangium sp. CA-135522]|uniref:hypothetical protein n=1 Tax=Streptosporangium sp. CA-135522 TaxID=3240072 RepID=UPI003D8A2D71
MITVDQFSDMTAKEVLTAWRENRLDPEIRIVAVNGPLDDPKSITYWAPTVHGWKI